MESPIVFENGKIPAFVLNHPNLSGQAVRLYHLLTAKAKRSRKEWFIFPQDQIAKLMGRSPRTIKRYLRELRAVGFTDEAGNLKPIIDPVRTQGGRNVYKMLPVPAQFEHPSIGDKIGPRITVLEDNKAVPQNRASLCLEKQEPVMNISLGKQQMDTPEGQGLIARMELLYFDWNVSMADCKEDEMHATNRQAANRRRVYAFVSQYNLAGLLFIIAKAEKTSKNNGAAVLQTMLKGKIYESEKVLLRKLAA